MSTAPDITKAKTSEQFEVIGTISGAKAHRIVAVTLLEDAMTERPVRKVFVPGVGYETVTEPVRIPAGTTLYVRPACGTIRSAGGWMVYENSYREAAEVTCTKCLKKA